MITIVITAPAKGQAHVRIDDPNNIMGSDLSPARQLCVQAILSLEGKACQLENVVMPLGKLIMLRNFVHSLGADNKGKMRRLLLMALMQLDDEDESLIYTKPFQGLPLLAK